MVDGGPTRRLTTILAADVAGYSRLVAADEEGTLARLGDYRRGLIDPKLAGYRGRVANTAGDSLLIEFPSVVDALRCAREIQAAVATANADLPEDERLHFRIGLNVGDVVEAGADLLGDGVNVAARLEGLAEPGGICLSRAVRDQIRDRMDVSLENLGEVEVKNIERPVRAFRVAGKGAVPLPPSAPTARRKLPVALGLLVLLAVAAGGGWWWQSGADVAPGAPGEAVLPLPDKPSIAVLPFDNLSGDPEQAYFADGMAEDIITDLSKLDGLFVIARNSSFRYRGGAVDLKAVGRELGVRYVLEGSVRRAGDAVRINAQLIDAQSGGHLWADRYDGSRANVFALQDKVTAEVVAALALKLDPEAKARLAAHDAGNPEAHDAYLKGWRLMQVESLENLRAAEPYLKQAVELDPGHGRAHAALAWLYYATTIIAREWYPDFGFLFASDAVARARGLLAVALRTPSAYAHGVEGRMLRFALKSEDALAAFDHALRLNPNDAGTLAYLADTLNRLGRPGEGLAHAARALRLDPRGPAVYRKVLGQLRFATEDYAGAVEILAPALRDEPDDLFSHYYLVAALGYLGRKEDAVAAIRHFDEQVVPAYLRAADNTFNMAWAPMRAGHLEHAKLLSKRQKQQIHEGLRRTGAL